MTEPILKITALGNSLTAGFGVGPEEGYPQRLERILNQDGPLCRIRNAGVNGDTCRGVLARLCRAMAGDPDWVILEIGINDFLMGAMPARIEASLAAIIQQLQAAAIQIVLAAMALPPLGDPAGERAFAALYPRVADRYGVPLLPKFLNPAFEVPGRVQFDGLHPNAAGYEAIARHLAPYVRQALSGGGPTPRSREI